MLLTADRSGERLDAAMARLAPELSRSAAQKLIEDGFDGYFSLEWEKKWHPELPDCDTEFPFYHDFMENCLK